MELKSLRQYVDLLKIKILHLNNKAVEIKNNKIYYSLNKIYPPHDISSYNQKVLGELGRAMAILHLITQHKIPPTSIYLEQKSPVGSPSKRTDIKIEISDVYNERNCIALVECKTSIRRISDSEFTNYFKRQLYNIAHSYAKDPEQPYPLILIAYEISFDGNKINILYKWFYYLEIEKTIETGQISLDEIISRNSPFAYDISPTILNNEIYFRKKPLTKDDLIDIRNPNELKNLLKEKIHQGLRNYGIVEEKAFNAIVNLLLAKTFDEIQLLTKNIPDFQVLPQDYLNKVSFYNRIKSLLENALVQLLGEDPRKAKNKEILDHKDKEKILLDIVPYLQRLKLRSLRFLGEDSMGDIFLDFMHSIFRQSRGLFFTHPNICRFVCKSLNIEKVGEELKKENYKYILDPACGSGTFLIEALRLIFKGYPIEKIKENALKILFGIDNESRAISLCKVNMVIHGDGSANVYERNALDVLSSLPFPNIKNTTIKKLNDSCTYEVIKEGDGFDIIITNPPFSLEIKEGEYPHFIMNKFVPFRKKVTTASECFFVERWFQLLNPGGQIGVVLPASLLDSPDYFKARLLLLCYFSIYAIVGLPDFAFSPHAQQKTYLVFGRRRSLEDANILFKLIVNNSIEEFIKKIGNEQITFFEAKEIGYVRVKQRKTVVTKMITENDLDDNLSEVISKASKSGLFGSSSEKGVMTITIKEIFKQNKDLKLTNFYYSSSLENKIILNDDWKIVIPKKIKKIDLQKGVLLCETGDIFEGGNGLLLPHLVKNNRLYELERNIITFAIFKNALPSELIPIKETSTSKRIRVLEKIRSNKFGKLKEGDIIIAPVRSYLKKIAVVTKSATKFLFSKDFIVLRRKKRDLEESFSLFLSLIHDANIEQLKILSSTGKSGYPKIKNKKAILQTEFYKIKTSPTQIEELIKLYDNIYKDIIKKYLK